MRTEFFFLEFVNLPPKLNQCDSNNIKFKCCDISQSHRKNEIFINFTREPLINFHVMTNYRCKQYNIYDSFQRTEQHKQKYLFYSTGKVKQLGTAAEGQERN